MTIRIKTISLLTLLTIFSSCHSVKYMATYEIKPTDNIDLTVTESSGLIRRLAKPYQHNLKCLLITDDKYKHNDTVAYFGESFHYFTFTFRPNTENNIIVTLDYWGQLRKGECYKTFLSAITDSLQKEFNIVKTDIREYRK